MTLHLSGVEKCQLDTGFRSGHTWLRYMHQGAPVARKPAKAFSDHRKVGYARVSTREQNLQLQLDALRAYGVMEDNLWFDVISGAKSKRPQLDYLFADARRGDTVVVWRLDRLGRNTRELLEWVERFVLQGIEFISLTEHIDTKTAGGKLTLRIMAAMAEFERDTIIQRTRAGIDAAKRAGKRTTPDVKMTPKVIADAKALLTEGKSVRDVAVILNVSRQSIYSRVGAKAVREIRRKAKAKRV